MTRLWMIATLTAFVLAPPSWADDAKKDVKDEKTRTFEVPYKFTTFQHVMVRAKLNGKGPFNFIIDTGAPALFVATEVADKIGVKSDKKGWGTFDTFELEGGVTIDKCPARIETPFQLKGMNGMGLAGAELHGMIGYTVLAKYRITFDFTKTKMEWTPIPDFNPEAPKGLDGKGAAMGGLDFMGSVMEMLGGFLGAKATPDTTQRGFLGIDPTTDDKRGVVIKSLLEKGPAGVAGLKVGDRIKEFDGRIVIDTADLKKFLNRTRGGKSVEVLVERNGQDETVKVVIGGGF